MGKHLLFVYGTLKSGYGNNAACLFDAKFVGKAITSQARYGLATSGVPFMYDVPSDGQQVWGEVYEVSDKTLARCDQLEGHPHAYRRQERYVDLVGDDTDVLVWIYLWPRNPRGRPVAPNEDGTLEWRSERHRFRAEAAPDQEG